KTWPQLRQKVVLNWPASAPRDDSASEWSVLQSMGRASNVTEDNKSRPPQTGQSTRVRASEFIGENDIMFINPRVMCIRQLNGARLWTRINLRPPLTASVHVNAVFGLRKRSLARTP